MRKRGRTWLTWLGNHTRGMQKYGRPTQGLSRRSPTNAICADLFFWYNSKYCAASSCFADSCDSHNLSKVDGDDR